MLDSKKIVLLIGSLATIAACTSTAQTDLSVPEFEKAITQKNSQILDVRSMEEYQSGHLKNALQANWNNEEEFAKRVQALDKSKMVYTYCLSGARSTAATKWLRQNGFETYNLKGGITAWKKENKPVEQIENIDQISMADYMKMIPSDKTVLVDIGATWCPPCIKMSPLIDSLVGIHGSKFVLVKIDGGAQTNICNELKIAGFPTFIIYKLGKEVWRKEGITDIKELVEKL